MMFAAAALLASRHKGLVPSRHTSLPRGLAVGLSLAFVLLGSESGFAFSQIGAQTGADATAKDGIVSVPLPPLPGGAATGKGDVPAATMPATAPNPATAGEAAPSAAPDASKTQPVPEEPSGVEPTPPSGAAAVPLPDAPPAPIYYGEDGLPGPVSELRKTLIEIAKAGDIEKLRPYLAAGEEGTVLSLAGQDGDPIEFLKSMSGDGEGVEILAILLETLEAGHVHNEAGSENEIYVWPYFTGVAIEKLTNRQKVELFELVTAGDYQEMLGFGAYNFYRVGITPDGKLQFFVAGD